MQAAVPKIRRSTRREAVKDFVLEMIRSGALKDGDALVSENELARMTRAAPLTVRRALGDLAEQGILHRIKGAGTYVGRQPLGRVNLAVVLPGKAMDKEHANPQSWHIVQGVFSALANIVSDTFTFSPLIIRPGQAARADIARLEQRYSAVLFMGESQYASLLAALVARGKIPVVVLTKADTPKPCLTIQADTRESVRRAISGLLGAGYRRIAYIGNTAPGFGDKFDGFMDAHNAAGIEPVPELLVKGVLRHEHGARAAEQLLARRPARARKTWCEVIFADTDIKAAGVINTLLAHGLQVPGDVRVLGYDGVQAYSAGPPYLTSIVIPFDSMLGIAAEQLQRLAANELPDDDIRLVARVRPGRTCPPYVEGFCPEEE